ncbi:MAG TPA: sugar phosphate nucleotidyltransferase [Bacteroidales bacterium]|nr:sugar phosphate nucleotidyltransferase [Bacteroidales bacterium]
MKAMIFAAGLGSRLHPVTSNKPKALVEVGGKTMLEHTLLHLKEHDITEVIINLHHFPGMIEEFVEDHEAFGMDVSFSREEKLLDTGGGLKKAAWFFNDDEPVLIRNVDILSDLDLNEMVRRHRHHQPLASLLVSKRETSRYLLFDEQHRLCGWEHMKEGRQKIVREAATLQQMAFNGIHIVNPAILSLLPDKEVFSITEAYLELSKNHDILAFEDTSSYWFDIGTSEKLEKARRFMAQK